MNKNTTTDLYFMDSRAKLLDLAAMIDRMERAEGIADFRWAAFIKALPILTDHQPDKARRVLEHFSDPTTAPLAKAGEKGAAGAWESSPENRSDHALH